MFNLPEENHTYNAALMCAPNSKQADHYRTLGNRMHDGGGKGIIPAAFTMDELEDGPMEHGTTRRSTPSAKQPPNSPPHYLVPK